MQLCHSGQTLYHYTAKFKTRGIRDSGNKEDEGDTVYLLAKELAYNVLTDQTDKLAAALAKVPGKDIVAFAQALKASEPTIDGKICGNSNTTADKCDTNGARSAKLSLAFAGAANSVSWPKKSDGHDNAGSVSVGLSGLSKDEKTLVAGHLAKSIEGGEVVEIRSVVLSTNDVQY